MPTVSLDQLQDAMEWVSTDLLDNEAYICRQTGKIYWIVGDPGMIDEDQEIPGDIDDSDKYLPIPDKRDLNLGNQLVFDFVSRYLTDAYDDVRDMFRRRGAYRRFKDLLEQKGLLEDWHRYSDEQEDRKLAGWCQSEGFALGP